MTTLLEVNRVGSRLRVRRARLDDAALSYRWFANPDVTRYLPLAGRGCIPISEIEAHLAFAALHDRPEVAVGIGLLGGRTIGCRGFHNFSDGSAELSLVLGEPDTWGRGLGYEAMQLLLQLGFGALALHEIWLEFAPTTSGECASLNGANSERSSTCRVP